MMKRSTRRSAAMAIGYSEAVPTANLISGGLAWLAKMGTVEVNHFEEFGYTISCRTDSGVIGTATPKGSLEEAIAETILSVNR